MASDVSIPLEMMLRVGMRASTYRLGACILTFFEEMFNDISFGFTSGFALQTEQDLRRTLMP